MPSQIHMLVAWMVRSGSRPTLACSNQLPLDCHLDLLCIKGKTWCKSPFSPAKYCVCAILFHIISELWSLLFISRILEALESHCWGSRSSEETNPKQCLPPILAFQCKLRKSYPIFPSVSDGPNRFLESLEDLRAVYTGLWRENWIV